MNKKIYLIFFLLTFLSLLLKNTLKKETVEEDYYNNKRSKKEVVEEIEKINYKAYLKRKSIKLNYTDNIFELNKPKETKKKEVEEIEESILEEISDERNLIIEEIEKIEFSGTIKGLNSKKIFLTYNNNLLDLKNGDIVKIYINNKTFDIYVSTNEYEDILLFYEPLYKINIRREM